MNVLVATFVLLFLDFLWIYLFMGPMYSQQIKAIQGTPMQTRLHFAVFSYILMIIGLNLFVLPNIREGHELHDSLLYGSTFGLVVYGIYDFTAAAVLSKWDIGLALVDVLWGSFVFFISAYLGSMFLNT